MLRSLLRVNTAVSSRSLIALSSSSLLRPSPAAMPKPFLNGLSSITTSPAAAAFSSASFLGKSVTAATSTLGGSKPQHEQPPQQPQIDEDDEENIDFAALKDEAIEREQLREQVAKLHQQYLDGDKSVSMPPDLIHDIVAVLVKYDDRHGAKMLKRFLEPRTVACHDRTLQLLDEYLQRTEKQEWFN